jgi:hypothetical protein
VCLPYLNDYNSKRHGTITKSATYFGCAAPDRTEADNCIFFCWRSWILSSTVDRHTNLWMWTTIQHWGCKPWINGSLYITHGYQPCQLESHSYCQAFLLWVFTICIPLLLFRRRSLQSNWPTFHTCQQYFGCRFLSTKLQDCGQGIP